MRRPPANSGTRLVVIGAGGNVADVSDIVRTLQREGTDIEIVALLDDVADLGEHRYGHHVTGPLGDWPRHDGARFISSIRNTATHRHHREIISALRIPPDRWVTLVDPRAHVSELATLGHGVYVCGGAALAAHARIGDHASVGPGAVIGHDTELRSGAIVAAGAVVGGRVVLGENCYVGSGSSVMPNVTIGDRALVGLGAVVINDVPPDHVVVGNPARTLRVYDDPTEGGPQ